MTPLLLSSRTTPNKHIINSDIWFNIKNAKTHEQDVAHSFYKYFVLQVKSTGTCTSLPVSLHCHFKLIKCMLIVLQCIIGEIPSCANPRTESP